MRCIAERPAAAPQSGQLAPQNERSRDVIHLVMAGTSPTYRRFHPAPYDEMVRTFRWEVPARYNIAADVLDKHDPSRLAMLWEDRQGNERQLTFGERQCLANR